MPSRVGAYMDSEGSETIIQKRVLWHMIGNHQLAMH